MAYEANGAHHILSLDDRNLLTLSAIKEVIGFDEQIVTVVTPFGQLVIEGESLHIDKLNLESGDLVVTGDICSLAYEKEQKVQKSFLHRLFG